MTGGQNGHFGALKTVNILILDPEPTCRAARQSLFMLAGHRAETVADGNQALAILRRRRFDILLFDPLSNDATAMPLLPLARLTCPGCRLVILTKTNLFQRGELFGMMPPAIRIVRQPVSDADLVIHCEHAVSRNAPARKPGVREAYQH